MMMTSPLCCSMDHGDFFLSLFYIFKHANVNHWKKFSDKSVELFSSVSAVNNGQQWRVTVRRRVHQRPVSRWRTMVQRDVSRRYWVLFLYFYLLQRSIGRTASQNPLWHSAHHLAETSETRRHRHESNTLPVSHVQNLGAEGNALDDGTLHQFRASYLNAVRTTRGALDQTRSCVAMPIRRLNAVEKYYAECDKE